MKKRGSLLILSLLVVVVITILITSFFSKAISNTNQVKRFVSSTQAFWLAEAGLADAVLNMTDSSVIDTLGSGSYLATINQIGSTPFFRINSTGTVTLPGGANIERQIEAIVETSNVTNDFLHAIRVTGELRLQGSYEIVGDMEENADLNFTDLFEHTTDEIEPYAHNHYTDPDNNILPVEGITWVNIEETNGELRITDDDWIGGAGDDSQACIEREGVPEPGCVSSLNDDNGAVLIVNGDTRITGGQFYGIIYVIGTLRISGNPHIYGTVLAETGVEITSITGNPYIEYNEEYIQRGLDYINAINPTIRAWREID